MAKTKQSLGLPVHVTVRTWRKWLADHWNKTTLDPSKTMRTMAAHLRSGGGRLR